jgi:hypothetical protein
MKVQIDLIVVTECYFGHELRWKTKDVGYVARKEVVGLLKKYYPLTSIHRLLLRSPAKSNFMTCLNWPGDLATVPLTCYKANNIIKNT